MNLTKKETIRELHVFKKLSSASILNILFQQSFAQNMFTIGDIMERSFIDLHESFLQKSLLDIILIVVESVQCSFVRSNYIVSIDDTLIECFAILLNSIFADRLTLSTKLSKEVAVFSNTHRVNPPIFYWKKIRSQ